MDVDPLPAAEWETEDSWPNGWAEPDRNAGAFEAAWAEVATAHGDTAARWCRTAGMTLRDADTYGIWNGPDLSVEQIQSVQRWWQSKTPPEDVALFLAVGLTSDDTETMRHEHIQLQLQHAYDDGLGPSDWRREWRRQHRQRG